VLCGWVDFYNEIASTNFAALADKLYKMRAEVNFSLSPYVSLSLSARESEASEQGDVWQGYTTYVNYERNYSYKRCDRGQSIHVAVTAPETRVEYSDGT
jgi:hypothetical protein